MTTAHCLDNMSGFEFKQMHKSKIWKDKSIWVKFFLLRMNMYLAMQCQIPRYLIVTYTLHSLRRL